MSPVLVTFTTPPEPALLPDPPTLSALESSSMLKAPATEKPPLPPPPPIDCARMPSEPAPSVYIEYPLIDELAELDASTVTIPALLPEPPLPPTLLMSAPPL